MRLADGAPGACRAFHQCAVKPPEYSVYIVGRPRQEVVASLGKTPELDQRDRHGWEDVADLLEGRSPSLQQGELGQPFAEELQPQWAQVDLRGVSVERVLDFGQIYGTAILPTRPAMPHHKGKVGAGVKYAQDNALKGRALNTLTEQNPFLLDWESDLADMARGG